MKRAWQFASLAVLALLVVQPALAGFACAPLAGARADCAICPSAADNMGDCAGLMAPIILGQTSCCQLDVPDSTPQVLVDRFTQGQGIGPAAVERVSSLTLPTLQSRELDHGRTLPLPTASFQSLYCTFLI